MQRTLHTAWTLLALACFAAAPLEAQQGRQRGAGQPGPPPEGGVVEVPTTPSIAWFGSWEGGLAEAKRTGRPIMLMSATPQCRGVPGMW